MKKTLLCIFILSTMLQGSVNLSQVAAWSYLQERIFFKPCPEGMLITIKNVPQTDINNWQGQLKKNSLIMFKKGLLIPVFRLWIGDRPDGDCSLLKDNDQGLYVGVNTQALFGTQAPESDETLVCCPIQTRINLNNATMDVRDTEITIVIPKV